MSTEIFLSDRWQFHRACENRFPTVLKCIVLPPPVSSSSPSRSHRVPKSSSLLGHGCLVSGIMDLLNKAQPQSSNAQFFLETSVPNVERIVRARRENSSLQICQCQAEKRNLEEALEILDGMEKMVALEGGPKQHRLSKVSSIKSRVSQAVNLLDGVTRTLERPPLVFITRESEFLDSVLQTLQRDCQVAIQPLDPPVSSENHEQDERNRLMLSRHSCLFSDPFKLRQANAS